MNKYEKRINVGLATRNKAGEIVHSRIITVRDREELEAQVEHYSQICTGYEAKITETPEGYLLLIWTEKA